LPVVRYSDLDADHDGCGQQQDSDDEHELLLRVDGSLRPYVPAWTGCKPPCGASGSWHGTIAA
jgi:hypothetical protein